MMPFGLLPAKGAQQGLHAVRAFAPAAAAKERIF